MPTKKTAMVMVLVCTAFTSIAQLWYKLAAASLELSVMGLLTNWYLIGGMALYAVAGGILIVSFRGGEVSVLFPIIATSYIWVSLLSMFYLGESMNTFKWAGIAAIFLGVTLVSTTRRKSNGN